MRENRKRERKRVDGEIKKGIWGKESPRKQKEKMDEAQCG